MCQSKTYSRFPIPRWALALAMLGTCLTATGCGLFGSSKSAVIKEAVDALSESKEELQQLNPEVQSVDVKADESGDGVVLQYTYKKEVVVDQEFNSDSLKTKLIAQFKDNEGCQDDPRL